MTDNSEQRRAYSGSTSVKSQSGTDISRIHFQAPRLTFLKRFRGIAGNPSHAMPLVRYEPFYLENLDDLRAEIARLALDIPVSTGHDLLGKPLENLRRPLANRFCAQPVSGFDALPDGSPGPLTLHRYRRLAAGGFSMVWLEATVPGTHAPPGSLRLHDDTYGSFARFMETLHKEAAQPNSPSTVFIIELALPLDSAPDGTTVLPPEPEITARLDDLIHAAVLAEQTGFDGIAIACTQGTLPHALLSACDDAGRFAGNFENRIRFLEEAVARTRKACPDRLIATRLLAYHAARHGFGVDPEDHRRPDLAEPLWLSRILSDAGLDLLNVASASPRLSGPPETHPPRPVPDGTPSEEHPLQALARHLHIAHTLREAVPGLPIVVGGFSWLRGFLPHVAAGALETGAMDIAGLGIEALACPDAPAQILSTGYLDSATTCIACFACAEMAEHGGPVGCPIRDPETYGPEFRRQHRFSLPRLVSAARRCHLCEHAPCSAASRTGTDIPGFIEAFRNGDAARAFETIRRSDPLPELTAHLTPGWLHSEGACLETTLTGTPVPIQDLQLHIAWLARQRGDTALRLPKTSTGRRITIAGAGPAGLAAAIRLLELGHDVEIFERSETLGGTPELLIPASRFSGAQPEINAILTPALDAGRLRIRHGMELGANLSLADLLRDAVSTLIAVGLWRERRPPGIQSPPRPDGVIDAISFLASAKQGKAPPVPERVAILAGGDTAMDAARTAEQLGAREIYVVFGGPRSEMHWHMAEEWFAEPGHHALAHCQPLEYLLDSKNRLQALSIRHTLLGAEAKLPVDLAIEATGLEPAAKLRAILTEAGVEFGENGLVRLAKASRTSLPGLHAAGALVNGGASVARCIAEGLAAAEEIHKGIF